MSAPIDFRNAGRPIHVGVVLMGGETEVLDVGPVDLLNSISTKFVAEWFDEMMDSRLKAQAVDFEFHWVNETGKTARLTGGITLQATDSFATAPPLDIALMGAHNQSYQPNEAELQYIRKTYEDASAFITVCGGMQAPLQAGILKGRSATAPRPMLEILKKIAPETQWKSKRWERDGKLWTSGSLLNGLDLMKAFVHETWGGEGSLADFAIDLGHWPIRDVDYADASSEL